MKKFLVVICTVILAFAVAGCAGNVGKGKGKAPVVTTKG